MFYLIYLLVLTPKSLVNGIPMLMGNYTVSSPSIPLPDQHAPCARIEDIFPSLLTAPPSVLSKPNNNWCYVSTADTLTYRSVSDIVLIVTLLLKDFIRAMGLSLDITSEISINRVRSDLCVLIYKRNIVGVVQIKTPGNNILMQPTVLGELLDQMLLIEGFYRVGPVIGILTTAEELMFTWFCEDDQYFKDIDSNVFTSLNED